jgi:DNA-binding CsgD family transcriptional regulator
MIQPLENSPLMAARRVSPRIHAVPAHKSSLIRFVDAVDCPVVLVNREGRLTTMNGPARDFFVGRTGAHLRESIEDSARLMFGDRRKADLNPNQARQYEIGHERFIATFVAAGNDVVSHDVGAMVMLKREALGAAAPQISEHALVRRFGLTGQEARVAVLLADQRTNREIADCLGVSVHTARHHTERVLAKLHIHSRYDVRRAIS